MLLECRMRQMVSKAKKKIQQQSDRIRLLESQLERDVSEGSIENFEPHFNKTTVSLFGTSPPISIETSTPSEQLNTQENYERSFSSTNSSSLDYDKTRNEADSENDSESTDISVEELVAYRQDNDVTRDDDVIRNVQTGSGLDVDQPQTCVSLFGDSIKTSPRRPLQLRRHPTNRIKYRNNTSSESVSSTSYENHSPSVLNETTELPSPECLSPRFLGSTPNHTPNHTLSPGTASLPLFHSTTKVNTSNVVTTPSGGQNNLIPISDSQFSLDVSQSFPPSPELCGGSVFQYSNKTSSNQEHFKPSSPNDQLLFPTVLPHTPSDVTMATIIPITPGITTVQTILGRTANGGGNSGIPKGNKRQILHEIEEILPARKKQMGSHIVIEDEIDSDNEVVIEAGSKVGQRQHVSNEEDDRA